MKEKLKPIQTKAETCFKADSETLCEETFIWLFIGNDPKKEQIAFLIRSDKLHLTLLKVYIPAQCIGMC